MTGPGNYAVAQDYAAAAVAARDREDLAEAAVLAAIGQVHATSAVAAAAVLQHDQHVAIRAWQDVTGQE